MTLYGSLNYKKIKVMLTKLGCYFVRKNTGTHEIWMNPKTGLEFTVVNHGSKTTPKGTLIAMLKSGEIDKDEFFGQK